MCREYYFENFQWIDGGSKVNIRFEKRQYFNNKDINRKCEKKIIVTMGGLELFWVVIRVKDGSDAGWSFLYDKGPYLYCFLNLICILKLYFFFLALKMLLN